MGSALRSESQTGVKRPVINRSWCKECGICVAFCPRGALSQCSGRKIELDAEKCSGCGMCEIYCPDFAIMVTEVDEK